MRAYFSVFFFSLPARNTHGFFWLHCFKNKEACIDWELDVFVSMPVSSCVCVDGGVKEYIPKVLDEK